MGGGGASETGQRFFFSGQGGAGGFRQIGQSSVSASAAGEIFEKLQIFTCVLCIMFVTHWTSFWYTLYCISKFSHHQRSVSDCAQFVLQNFRACGAVFYSSTIKKTNSNTDHTSFSCLCIWTEDNVLQKCSCTAWPHGAMFHEIKKA